MADSHISLLEAIARHQQRRVDRLDAGPGPDHSTGRRAQLTRVAGRARAQVTAAAARRRLPPDR
ncbi:hypothetical protein [Conexibacter woesei]|uniref:hypothetical protein n=1 Tax=Conexibacter woesei TaxID=191495 RepID=UPI0003F7AC63|nr:hypothetical protein [Conexibacter woesei]